MHLQGYSLAQANERFASAAMFESAPLEIRLAVELKVSETRGAVEKPKMNRADWAIAVLGDDQVGDAFAVRIGIVYFFAIDEHDDIRVLFNRATLT
jgi:hypothetical protein